MTDAISKAAKAKAKELIAAITRLGPNKAVAARQALERVLQEHSDIAREVYDSGDADRWSLDEADALLSMILPDDEPDPLEEAMNAVMGGMGKSIRPQLAADIRQFLDAAGYEIRRKDGK